MDYCGSANNIALGQLDTNSQYVLGPIHHWCILYLPALVTIDNSDKRLWWQKGQNVSSFWLNIKRTAP